GGGLGLAQLVLAQIEVGQTVQAFGDREVFLPELLPAQGERAFEEDRGALVEAEAPVGPADGESEGGLDLRLSLQLLQDLLPLVLEQLAGGAVLAARLFDVRAADHLLQEAGHLDRLVPLAPQADRLE